MTLEPFTKGSILKSRRKSTRSTRGKGKTAARRRPTAAAPNTSAPDPLDEFILSAARSLDLTIEQAWMPAVRANLRVTLMLGAQVNAFALPDDAEPAPVFRA